MWWYTWKIISINHLLCVFSTSSIHTGWLHLFVRPSVRLWPSPPRHCSRSMLWCKCCWQVDEDGSRKRQRLIKWLASYITNMKRERLRSSVRCLLRLLRLQKKNLWDLLNSSSIVLRWFWSIAGGRRILMSAETEPVHSTRSLTSQSSGRQYGIMLESVTRGWWRGAVAGRWRMWYDFSINCRFKTIDEVILVYSPVLMWILKWHNVTSRIEVKALEWVKNMNFS